MAMPGQVDWAIKSKFMGFGLGHKINAGPIRGVTITTGAYYDHEIGL